MTLLAALKKMEEKEAEATTSITQKLVRTLTMGSLGAKKTTTTTTTTKKKSVLQRTTGSLRSLMGNKKEVYDPDHPSNMVIEKYFPHPCQDEDSSRLVFFI